MVAKGFVRGMGIALFVLGIVGAIGIITTFDFDQYNLIKDSIAYEDEADIMKGELVTTWITAIGSLVGCWVVGTVLLALERIIHAIESK